MACNSLALGMTKKEKEMMIEALKLKMSQTKHEGEQIILEQLIDGVEKETIIKMWKGE